MYGLAGGGTGAGSTVGPEVRLGLTRWNLGWNGSRVGEFGISSTWSSRKLDAASGDRRRSRVGATCRSRDHVGTERGSTQSSRNLDVVSGDRRSRIGATSSSGGTGSDSEFGGRDRRSWAGGGGLSDFGRGSNGRKGGSGCTPGGRSRDPSGERARERQESAGGAGKMSSRRQPIGEGSGLRWRLDR